MRRITLMTSDAIGAFLVALLFFWGLTVFFPDHTYYQIAQIISIFIVLIGIALAYFTYRGHYSWRTPWWQQVRHVTAFSFGAMISHVLLNYIAVKDLPAQPEIVFAWLAVIPSLLFMRLVGRAYLKSVNHWDIATVIVGSTSSIIDTIYALKSEFYLTYKIQYVVPSQQDETALAALRNEHPAVEIREELGDIPSHSMVIICPGENDQTIGAMVESVRKTGAKFAIVPPTGGFSLYGMQPQYFFGYNVVLMETRYRLKTFWGSLLKSTFDRSMALIGLILLAPVFLVLMNIVRKDGGPAFYGQPRVGKDGKLFKCWKFRSMVTNSQEVLQNILETDPDARAEWERDFKLKNDPRITKIGHFLRKSSLDEIPQLYNVLCGQMSLVGPRPIVQAEEKYYADRFEYYLAVRPGITGLWQVSGRNDVTYDQRVALDCWYVENWSIWNDLVILFKTTFVVLNRKGAY
jgi:undecaprenyl-phosphate galactose phosphotransferase